MCLDEQYGWLSLVIIDVSVGVLDTMSDFYCMGRGMAE